MAAYEPVVTVTVTPCNVLEVICAGADRFLRKLLAPVISDKQSYGVLLVEIPDRDLALLTVFRLTALTVPELDIVDG